MTVATGVEFWGPCAWKFLHAISFAIPESPDDDQVHHLTQFFGSAGHVLPCPACGVHYNAYIESHRADFARALRSGPLLQRFLWELHNEVNDRRGKPDNKLDFGAVQQMYTQGSAPGCPRPASLRHWADPHFGNQGGRCNAVEALKMSSDVHVLAQHLGIVAAAVILVYHGGILVRGLRGAKPASKQ
jgi:hypothetical protein